MASSDGIAPSMAPTASPFTRSPLNIPILLQGGPCPGLLANLGWVDFDLGCSTILPTFLPTSVNFPSAQLESGYLNYTGRSDRALRASWILARSLIFEAWCHTKIQIFLEETSREGWRKGMNMGSNPKSCTLIQYEKFDFRRGGREQSFLIWGLLRLQTAKIFLIPANKFEFWCDTPASKISDQPKILLALRALSGSPWLELGRGWNSTIQNQLTQPRFTKRWATCSWLNQHWI